MLKNTLRTLVVLNLTVSLPAAPPHLSQNDSLAIKTVTLDKTTVKTYQRFTLEVDLTAAYDNPFDPADISLDVRVTEPDGAAWSAPGFLFQPYSREDTAPRRTQPAGPPRWQCRLSFSKPGRHRLTLTARDRSGSTTFNPLSIDVQSTDHPGFVRRHPTDHRYFVTERGEAWFPIGANVCWGESYGNGPRHVFAYDDWLARYAENDANIARLWLSLNWNDLALINQKSGYDRFDLQAAWHLDHVVELAEKLGLRLMLCFDAHGMLRSKKRSTGFWEDSPFHPQNGAPFQTPAEFFSNEKSLQAYRARLRYLVARWGYSPAVFAWEFWNEVDLIDDYQSKRVADWHRNMARYLRRIDPWKHLITTSYANPRGDPLVDELPELDFVQSHHYQALDIALALAHDKNSKSAARNRPHFHGEFGISHSGRDTGQKDPTGIHLRNGLFSSIGQQQAGTPMSWWWDSYIHPRNLYPIFRSFARWIDGFDVIAQKPKPINAYLEWINPAAPRPLADLILPAVGGFDRHPTYGKTTTLTIDATGRISPDLQLPPFLHGLRNHPELHNPLIINLDAPRPAKFTVQVLEASGHGGAVLSLSLDGQPALQKQFVHPDNPDIGGVLKNVAGDVSLDLPPGRHTIQVESTGKDWIKIKGFILPQFASAAVPNLRISGLLGRTRALVWIQNPHHTWSRAAQPDYKLRPVSPCRLSLDEVPPGNWTIDYFDTRAGLVINTLTQSLVERGPLKIELPLITTDLALRLYQP